MESTQVFGLEAPKDNQTTHPVRHCTQVTQVIHALHMLCANAPVDCASEHMARRLCADHQQCTNHHLVLCCSGTGPGFCLVGGGGGVRAGS